MIIYSWYLIVRIYRLEAESELSIWSITKIRSMTASNADPDPNISPTPRGLHRTFPSQTTKEVEIYFLKM